MEHDLDKFFSFSPQLLCIATVDGYFKKISNSFPKLLGWSQQKLLSDPFLSFVHPDDREATLKELENLKLGTVTSSFINRFRTAWGSYVYLRWAAYPETETGLLYSIAQDITERKNDEQRFRLAVEASPSAMFMIQKDDTIIMANKEANRIFGYNEESMIGTNFHLLVPPRFRPGHKQLHQGFMKNAQRRQMGIGMRLTAARKDGSEFPIEVGLNPIATEEGMFILCGINDLTAIENAEKEIINKNRLLELANQKLENMASTDALTQLKNRRVFFEQLEYLITSACRNKEYLSLIFLDIDNFKSYNDLFGHQAGDYVLKTVGKLLAQSIRRSDLAARYGGEEFTVILPHTAVSGAMILGENIRHTIESHGWTDRPVTASFGVTSLLCQSKGGDSADIARKIIAEADEALYRSKGTGKNRVTHFQQGGQA